MDKLIALVIIVLSFTALMHVQAFAQNITVQPAPPTPTAEAVATSYTAFITAVGTLVGTIGSIIGVIAVFIRDTKTKGLAQQIGLGMVTFGQKTVENTDRIKNLTKAGITLAPEEAKKFLEQNQMTVENLTESVNKGTEQLQVIKDNIPGGTTAKISAWQKTLPKESFETRPGATA